MEIAQLRYFLAASETENFTAAAKKCFTSRQNLTRSIRNLEDELDVTLFSRTGNSTKLTAEGERAVDHARIIVDETRILEDEFKSDTSIAPLKVLLGTKSNFFLPQQVFDEAFSFDFAVSEFDSQECYEAVVKHECDVAFIWCMERDFPGCSDVLVRRDRLFYLVDGSSELARRKSLRVEDLAGHDVCMIPDPAFNYRPFLARYRKHGMDESHLRQIGSTALAKNENRHHDAVAFSMSEFKLHPLPGTVAVPCAEDEMEACIYALYQRGTERVSSVLKLITRIRQLCNEVYGTTG